VRPREEDRLHLDRRRRLSRIPRRQDTAGRGHSGDAGEQLNLRPMAIHLATHLATHWATRLPTRLPPHLPPYLTPYLPPHRARKARMASPCFATLKTPSRWPPSPSMMTTSATPPCARYRSAARFDNSGGKTRSDAARTHRILVLIFFTSSPRL